MSDTNEMNERQEQPNVDTTTPPESEGWRAALRGDLKNIDDFQQMKNPNDLADKYLELKKGNEQKVEIPDVNTSDEEKNKFYEKLGVPNNADGYEIPIPDEIKEFADDNFISEYKEVASQAKLSKEQAKQLANWYHEKVKGQIQGSQKAEQEAEAKLKQEWQGDEFEENKKLAADTFKELFGGDEDALALMEKAVVDGVRLGNHPQFLKMFYNLHKKISDDTTSDVRKDANGNIIITDEEKAKRMFPSMMK